MECKIYQSITGPWESNEVPCVLSLPQVSLFQISNCLSLKIPMERDAKHFGSCGHERVGNPLLAVPLVSYI